MEVGGGTLCAGYKRHVACLRKREKEKYACPDPKTPPLKTSSGAHSTLFILLSQSD